MSPDPTPLELFEAWDVPALLSGINGWAPFVGAGIEVEHLAEDASEVRVRMPLTEANANLVGVQFGGSLYAMTDPFLMILLMRRLGPGYRVWDRSASVEFLRPGTGEVRATVRVTEDEIAAVRAATADGAPHRPTWVVDVTDETGEVVARVTKELWVRRTPADQDETR